MVLKKEHGRFISMSTICYAEHVLEKLSRHGTCHVRWGRARQQCTFWTYAFCYSTDSLTCQYWCQNISVNIIWIWQQMLYSLLICINMPYVCLCVYVCVALIWYPRDCRKFDTTEANNSSYGMILATIIYSAFSFFLQLLERMLDFYQIISDRSFQMIIEWINN